MRRQWRAPDGQIIAVGGGFARRQSQCKVGPSRHVPRALSD